MVIKLSDYYKRCPDCKRQFLPSTDSVDMQVTLMEAIRSYTYCSNVCFEKALSKLNVNTTEFEKVKVIFKERVSSKPDKWLVALEHDMPQIRLLN